MSVNRFVKSDITTLTGGASFANFGTPMFFSYHDLWTPVVRSFGTLQEVADAGVPLTHPIWLAASAHFGQKRHAATFKVAKRTAYTKIFHLDPGTTITEGDVFSGVVYGPAGTEAFSYTAVALDGVAEVIAGLIGVITGLTSAVTATDGTTHVIVTADNAGEWFAVRSLVGLSLSDETADSGIAADYLAASTLDNEFYGITMDSKSAAEVTAMAAIAETNKKIFAFTTHDSDAADELSTTDIIAAIETIGYDYAAGVYTRYPTEFLEVRRMAERFSRNPGSYTWFGKDVAGATPDALLESEINGVTGKNGNVFIRCKNINVFTNGTAASGEFLDTVRLADYTNDQVTTRVFTILTQNAKLPFIQGGLQVIGAEIEATIKDVAALGGLDPDTVNVVVPALASIPETDRAARCASQFTWSADLAGAIQKVLTPTQAPGITGTLGV